MEPRHPSKQTSSKRTQPDLAWSWIGVSSVSTSSDGSVEWERIAPTAELEPGGPPVTPNPLPTTPELSQQTSKPLSSRDHITPTLLPFPDPDADPAATQTHHLDAQDAALFAISPKPTVSAKQGAQNSPHVSIASSLHASVSSDEDDRSASHGLSLIASASEGDDAASLLDLLVRAGVPSRAVSPVAAVEVVGQDREVSESSRSNSEKGDGAVQDKQGKMARLFDGCVHHPMCQSVPTDQATLASEGRPNAKVRLPRKSPSDSNEKLSNASIADSCGDTAADDDDSDWMWRILKFGAKFAMTSVSIVLLSRLIRRIARVCWPSAFKEPITDGVGLFAILFH
ncbi:hypothetical protein BC830DRAFT_1152686 [Chytriomyces sp. MP71]|nr:hypothetical protein BC830DRAFT_1152686 [Chytriomyces sp. MP71]